MKPITRKVTHSVIVPGAFLAATLLASSVSLTEDVALDPKTNAVLDGAIAGEHRSDGNRARDKYRRPKETLAFFGFRSDMTVVEFSPGGGWYTEVLAPTVRDSGKLYAAHYSANAGNYERRSLGGFLRKIGAAPAVYDQVVVTTISGHSDGSIAPPGSADMAVTFRNVHNWVEPSAGGEANAIATFSMMFEALKSGGTLGVVAHRWPDPATADPNAGNGYLSEDHMIAMAGAAGFEFVARSDHNRNPKDTHDHPNGVWTLPPDLDIDEAQRNKYLEIGESDRMTLRFRKP